MTDLGRLGADDRAMLEATLVELDLDDAEPLVVNDWKRAATLAATDRQGRRVVLKWHSPSADARVARWFERERAALHHGVPGGLGLGLLDDGDNWLLLPFVAGRSALDALDTGLSIVDGQGAPGVAAVRATRRWLDAVLPVYGAALASGTTAADRPGPRLRDVTSAIHRSMARSGPMRTVRTTTSAAIGAAVAATTAAAVQRIVAGRPNLAWRGWAHGDLHLDNIWLTDDGRVVLLDLATADAAGFPAMDLAYAAAATLARTAGHPAAGEAIAAQLEDRLATLGPVGADIVAVAGAFAAVGRTNPRFAPDLGGARRLLARARAPLGLSLEAVRR